MLDAGYSQMLLLNTNIRSASHNNIRFHLALLGLTDCVSRANVMALASVDLIVVRQAHF